MLRVCALQNGRSWDKSLLYAKFSYNNTYQESLKMASFEMYGRRCRKHPYSRMRQENDKFMDVILSKTLRSKYTK
jgi:hypothetical protein